MTARLYLELAAALIVVAGFFTYRHVLIADGEQKIEAADAQAVETQKAAIAKQEAADAQVLKEAQDVHQSELQALSADHLAHPLPAVRLCDEPSRARSVPPTPPVPGHPDSAPGILPADAAMHPPGPDISASLSLLVDRADQLSADARELQTLTRGAL